MLSIWKANFKNVFTACVGLPGFNEATSRPNGFVSAVFLDMASHADDSVWNEIRLLLLITAVRFTEYGEFCTSILVERCSDSFFNSCCACFPSRISIKKLSKA